MFIFKKDIIVFLIILFGLIFSVRSQDYIWRDITANHPIRTDIVETLLETRDGLIWIGNKRSGLWIYDGYDLKNIDPKWFGLPTTSFNSIASLYETADSNIWIGTKYNGVTVLNPYKAVAKKLKTKDDPLIEEAITRVLHFYLDKDDIMWMATHKGLVGYNMETQEFRLFQTDLPPHKHNNLNPSLFRYIVPDTKDSTILWIGGLNGLFSFDRKTQLLKHHRHPIQLHEDYGNMDFLPQHRQYLITDIEIVENSIFTATWGGGVMEYKPADDTWKRHIFEPYTPKNALDENIANSIVAYDDKLFFGAIPKAGFFDLKDRTIHLIDNSVNKKRKNFFAVLRDKNDVLWWSTYGNGIHSMKIAGKDYKPSQPSSLMINTISLDDKPVFTLLKDKIPETVIIPPEHDLINLNISLINPMDTANVEYQYQLVGYDPGWISNGISRHIEYLDLPGDSYILRIRACESGEKWQFAHELTIQRKVYFYHTEWFVVFCFILVIAVLYILYRIRIRTIRKKEKIQRQMTELKLQALQAQMNPHFTFNALNSINSFILSNKSEKASDFLTKFSRLIRQVLNNSKQTMVSLSDELQALRLYIELEQLRFENHFYYRIDVDDCIDTDSIQVPPLLLQPYVENAIWHGLMHKKAEGNIDILIEKENDQLLFKIIDDGIGREKASIYKSKYDSNKKSLGMSITKDRIGLLNNLYQIKATSKIVDLYDEHNNSKGTMVEISIPVVTQ